MATFFLDALNGDDQNVGTVHYSPWKTLDKLLTYIQANQNGAHVTAIFSTGVYYPVTKLTGALCPVMGINFVGNGTVVFRNPYNAALQTMVYDGNSWIRFKNIHFVKMNGFVHPIPGGYNAVYLVFEHCGFDDTTVNTDEYGADTRLLNVQFFNCTCSAGKNFPATISASNPNSVIYCSTGMYGNIPITRFRCAENGIIQNPGNLITNNPANYPSITGAFSGLPVAVGYLEAPAAPNKLDLSNPDTIRIFGGLSTDEISQGNNIIWQTRMDYGVPRIAEKVQLISNHGAYTNDYRQLIS